MREKGQIIIIYELIYATYELYFPCVRMLKFITVYLNILAKSSNFYGLTNILIEFTRVNDCPFRLCKDIIVVYELFSMASTQPLGITYL
jgi:hypothetical protein